MFKDQKIGIGGIGGDVWLYCDVHNVEIPFVHGWVINGNWEFTLNTAKNILTAHGSPSGDTVTTNVGILFYDYIPATEREWYNDAIEYMNRNKMPVFKFSPWVRIKMCSHRLVGAFAAAVGAFITAWGAPSNINTSREKVPVIIENDDIPY